MGLGMAVALIVCRPAIAAEPLTLEAGLQIALAGTPSLKASACATAAAREIVRDARGRFLPRLDLSESFMRTTGPGEVFWTELSQERFSLGRFAASNPNDPDPINNYTTSVTLSQPLYAGGRIRTGYEISKLQQQAAEQDERRTRQEVIREFTAAFYGALLAERLVGVAETARRAVDRHAAMAADLLAQGLVLRSDHLRARVRPIVLTAAALIVGALVILLDPIFQGLAISLIFGIFASTALTLIVIPLLYYMVRKGKQDGGCASETEQGRVP